MHVSIILAAGRVAKCNQPQPCALIQNKGNLKAKQRAAEADVHLSAGIHLDKLHVLGAAGAGHMSPTSFCNLHSNTTNTAAASMDQYPLAFLHLGIVKRLQ